APPFTRATTWSALTASEQAQIMVWMDNAAKNACGAAVPLGGAITDASGFGWRKGYSMPTGPNSCGIVDWNNATNCASFLAANPALTSAATKILDRFTSLGGEAGLAGMPLSNPTTNAGPGAGVVTSYQEFTNGFFTYRSGDSVAHFIGGTDRALKAAARLYAETNDITRNRRPPLNYPLAGDVLCIDPSDQGCGSSGGGYYWETWPYLGSGRRYVSEIDSDVA